MHREIGYGAARNKRRQQDGGSAYCGGSGSEKPAAQSSGKGTFTALGLFVAGRLAAFFDRQDGFDRALTSAERNDYAMDALGRHEAGGDGYTDRQRTQRQQAEKPPAYL